MKNLLILLIVTLLSSCGLFKKKESNEPTVIKEEPQAEKEIVAPTIILDPTENPPEGVQMAYGEVCEAFKATLQSGSLDQFIQYLPTVAIARAMSPTETTGKSDKDVQIMIDGLSKTFLRNIKKIQESAEENNVDLTKLMTRNCIYYKSDAPPMEPRVLSVQLSSGTVDFNVPITILNYSGKSYVFEILNTTNLFKK